MSIALELLGQLLKSKAGICLLVAIGLFAGGWYTKGKFADAEIKERLERQIEQANALAAEDAELLEASYQNDEKIRKVFIKVKSNAEKTELCSNGGNDFLRLFNNAVDGVNQK